jgi:hypothetical protein
LKILATAHRHSGIDKARFTIKAEGRQAELSLQAGDQSEATLDLLTTSKELIDIGISVHSVNRSVSAYGKQIPQNSEIQLFGLNPTTFLGYILHSKHKDLAKHCKLQCTPTDTPVMGPGCLDCEKAGLIFKICC